MFDPAQNLPQRLQERIDAWEHSPPKHQHQVYGPLNAYLSLKFGPEQFLVKPQALLRKETAEGLIGLEDLAEGDGEGEGGDERGVTEEEDSEEVGDVSFESVDSHGVAVTKEKRYPDFNIDQYWGADTDENPHADIVRVVIEVGSSERDRWAVTRQLTEYVDWVGTRAHEKLLAVGLAGNKVIMYSINDDRISTRGRYGRWMSLFDPRALFVEELNRIRQMSMNADGN
ncbi:hypothetical protein GLOTRDRAFT_140513 [Gloeophyllum trabeum ATCC 11539]|uniref:Uncharacterized protein n=1 Tax=Gloeophyllum trabeum (strain ATCC 11539 / FP-39264 / Madison 617) TaxID=670483 RepID=S7RCX8_GLOTA|nr:uncharacterized protein GLOTRDRAFT_140513 [Gloeophyllum trabeum ATCC 11539]EPQ52050.1 hypothetical protein GLOTRDRAFT_140513 [Gloeophyllum trabeum ATCC 11539]